MSFQKTKIDENLGYAVERHLKSLGLNTPTTKFLDKQDNKDKIEVIQHHLTKVWETLGMDLTDDSLADTPNRIAKMMVLDHHWGLLPENFPKITAIENKMHYDEMITLTGLPIMSQCEHHGVTFSGNATIAYIPKNKVVGLSKLGRVAEYFSRRPQVQERLTAQIQKTLEYILDTENVAVAIKAQHFCMITRGTEIQNSWTHTTKLGGLFQTDPLTKSEFLSLMK